MDPEKQLEESERLEWTQDFMEQLKLIRQRLTSRHPGVADACAVAYGMVPSQYRDEELRTAYETCFVEDPDLSSREDFESFQRLLTAFMDWCDRHHVLPWRELGDDTERTWEKVRGLARRGELDEIRRLLGVDQAEEVDDGA